MTPSQHLCCHFCFYCAFSSAFESIIHNLLLQAILWCSCDLIKRNTFNITFVSRMFVPSMTLSLSSILYHVILFMPICHDSVINPYFLLFWIHQLHNLPLQNQICLCLVFTILSCIVLIHSVLRSSNLHVQHLIYIVNIYYLFIILCVFAFINPITYATLFVPV